MKKGFTLIELLAVIVILAIIALIATPIVLNIINDAKESSVLRSAEFYMSGLENSIANILIKNKQIEDGTYSIMKDGNVCIGILSNNKCNGEILKVEINGEIPKIGSISILEGKLNDVSLNIGNKIIGKNNKGEMIYLNKLTDICELKNGEAKKAGSKYECKVNAGTKYMFYVLTTPESGTKIINLIMDQNINSDGTGAGIIGVTQEENATKYNLVAWNSSELNTDGPVTAMKFLYDATKNWTNIPLLNYTYNDKDFQMPIKENISYTSLVSNNGIATIKSLTGTSITIGTLDEPLRARMPIYSGVWNDDLTAKISEKGDVADKKSDNSNSYLYDNLDSNGTLTPYGYWTLSSQIKTSKVAWRVTYDGYVRYNNVSYDTRYGVRPVISLNIGE